VSRLRDPGDHLRETRRTQGRTAAGALIDPETLTLEP
jgi:hypothetical protein